MSLSEQKRLALQVLETAIDKAEASGLELKVLDTDARSFLLNYWRSGDLVWSVELQPTRDNFSLVKWDQEHRGPVLPLPRPWTILDAVNAMIEMKNLETAKSGERKRPKPTMGVRKRRR